MMIPERFIERIRTFAVATGHVGVLLPSETAMKIVTGLQSLSISARSSSDQAAILKDIAGLADPRVDGVQKRKAWQAIWADRQEDILIAGVLVFSSLDWTSFQGQFSDPFVTSDFKKFAKSKGVKLLKGLLASVGSHEVIVAFLGKSNEAFFVASPGTMAPFITTLFERCAFSKTYMAYASGRFASTEAAAAELMRASLL
jgi:hypothetical protein